MSKVDSHIQGCDLIIANSSARENRLLKTYFEEVKDRAQPTSVVLCEIGKDYCFMTLDEVIAKAGVNPFDLPLDTTLDDPRVQQLIEKVGFIGGVQFKIGLPTDLKAYNCPDLIVDNEVFLPFNEIHGICTNTKPQQLENFKQEGDEVWLVSMGNENFSYQEIPQNLNTPYYEANPTQRDKILRAVDKLGAQVKVGQLVLDVPKLNVLENIDYFYEISMNTSKRVSAYMDEVLRIVTGITYHDELKKYGSPVMHVQLSSATSRLNITDMTAYVNGTSNKSLAPTLDYHCAINHRTLEGKPARWDWITDHKVAGAMGMRRTSVGRFYYPHLVKQFKQLCIATYTHVDAGYFAGDVAFTYSLTPNKKPNDVVFPESGDVLVRMSYSDSDTSTDKRMSNLLFNNYGRLTLSTESSCEMIVVSSKRFKIKQHLKISFIIQHMNDKGNGVVIDHTREDFFDLVQDNMGEMQIMLDKDASINDPKPESIDIDHDFLHTGNVSRVIDTIRNMTQQMQIQEITENPFDELKQLVFPGADTFSFKDAQFSNARDLVCDLLYVKQK